MDDRARLLVVPTRRLNLLMIFCGLGACIGCEWFNWTPKGETPVSKAPAITPEKTTTNAPSKPNLAAPIGLSLKVGDRFPLQKSIIQTLIQPSESGHDKSQTRLELLLTVRVEELPRQGPHAGHKRMSVHYQWVKYHRELPGEIIDYDSRAARSPLSIAVLGYHGLAGNSFSIWLSEDNQILEIVDFKAFMERCLRGVPPRQVAQVWSTLASESGTEGIANFVNDSLGLLPKKPVKIGDSWTVARQITQPVPMILSTKYMLQSRDDSRAEISINGTILPSANFGAGVEASSTPLSITVTGGNSRGSCTVDRRTGLPLHSQVEQYLDMKVRLGDGGEFVQHKQTITTIQAFPEGSTSPGRRPPPAVTQAAQHQPARTAQRPSDRTSQR